MVKKIGGFYSRPFLMAQHAEVTEISDAARTRPHKHEATIVNTLRAVSVSRAADTVIATDIQGTACSNTRVLPFCDRYRISDDHDNTGLSVL